MNTAAKCSDTRYPGARNQKMYDSGGVAQEACDAAPTHKIGGYGLCKTHWKQALDHRQKTDRSLRSYSNQLRNYQR